MILYCIPIPCENKWVNNNYNNNSNNNNSNNNNNSSSSLSNKKKRNIDDANMENENDEDNKKSKDEQSTTTTTTTNSSKEELKSKKLTNNKIDINKIFNYPIPIDSNDENNIKTPFIVNIYDDDVVLDENNKPVTFKINEIIEFIGVVAKFDPTLQHQSFASSSSNQIEDETPIIDLMSMLDVDEISTIPDTLIPQFHAITYRYLDPYQLNHLNPFSTTNSATINSNTTINNENNINNNNSNSLNNNNNKNIREELIKFIKLFIVDELLSEYLLFHLISKVYSFTTGLCIGNFSMNISIPNDKEFQRLPELIERLYEILLARSYRFSMSLDNLNDMDVVPYKDYDRNRIVSGLLQLPKGTNLILDETLLAEGKLESQGIKVLNALNTLSIQQKVEYDFKYHPIEIQTDLPTISISFGKSLIKGTTQISIDKSIKLPTIDEINLKMNQQNGIYNDDHLNQFRNYINYCKNLTFKISSPIGDGGESDDATRYIQEDFVKSRQLDPKMSTDVFHYWLTLSRLVALSYQDQYIKIDKWNIMKSLEEKRKSTQ
ncbi:hypothetical protein ACTFIU_007419 [Dictyostelium citrinum]